VRRRSSLAQITDMIWGSKSSDKASTNNYQNASQGTVKLYLNAFNIERINEWGGCFFTHVSVPNPLRCFCFQTSESWRRRLSTGGPPPAIREGGEEVHRSIIEQQAATHSSPRSFLLSDAFQRFKLPLKKNKKKLKGAIYSLFSRTGGGGGSSSRSRTSMSGSGRRESLVDMAFGNLPWIRRQSSTTSGPTATTAASSSSITSGLGDLRKRRDSAAAAFPKKTVTQTHARSFISLSLHCCQIEFGSIDVNESLRNSVVCCCCCCSVCWRFVVQCVSCRVCHMIRGDGIRAWAHQRPAVPVLLAVVAAAVQSVSTSPSFSSCRDVMNATALYRPLQASVAPIAQR